MAAPALPSWSEIEAASRALSLAATPAELHGGLCGWLAGGGADDASWLSAIVGLQDPMPAAGDALEHLRRASAAQLADRDFAFELLLPAPDASLPARSEALFDWCRGFLGGLGLAAGNTPGVSEEGREALTDLARLAAAQPEPDGDEEDEAALAEIEEFVRVAALLLHGDCVMAPRHRRQLN